MDLDLEAWVHGAWAGVSMDLDLEDWAWRVTEHGPTHGAGASTERARSPRKGKATWTRPGCAARSRRSRLCRRWSTPRCSTKVHTKKKVLAVFHVVLRCTDLDPEMRPHMRAVAKSLDRRFSIRISGDHALAFARRHRR